MTPQTEKLKKLIKQKYPSYLSVLVSGSVVDNLNCKESDVDLIVFTSDRSQLYNETILFEKLKVQTIVIPVHRVEERLYLDYLKGQGHFICMIAKSKILFSKSNWCENLIEHCEQLRLIGPSPLTLEDDRRLRTVLTGLRNKLDNTKVLKENLLLEIGELSKLLSELKLRIGGKWVGNGIHRIRFLKTAFPEFAKKLLGAVKRAHSTNDFNELIQLTEITLQEGGGKINYYSKSNPFVTINSDFLCLFIPYIQIESCKRELIKIRDYFLSIEEQLKGDVRFYFFRSNFDSFRQQDENTFCIIHANRQWLNNELVPSLREQNISENVQFPYYFSPSYNFGNVEFYNFCLASFIYVSRQVFAVKQNILDEGFQIMHGLQFLNSIKENLFPQQEVKFQVFLNYIFQCWIPYSYDNEHAKDTRELLKIKNRVIQNYSNFLLTNQAGILKLLEQRDSFFYSEQWVKILESIKSSISGLGEFPKYKDYLINDSIVDGFKKSDFAFLKEYCFRVFSVLLISAEKIPFLIYVFRRLNKNESKPLVA